MAMALMLLAVAIEDDNGGTKRVGEKRSERLEKGIKIIKRVNLVILM